EARQGANSLGRQRNVVKVSVSLGECAVLSHVLSGRAANLFGDALIANKPVKHGSAKAPGDKLAAQQIYEQVRAVRRLVQAGSVATTADSQRALLDKAFIRHSDAVKDTARAVAQLLP